MIPFGPYLAGGAVLVLLVGCTGLDVLGLYESYAKILPLELTFGPDGLLVP